MSDKTTGWHYRINVFDNVTEELVTEIVLTREQVEALRPYLHFGDDRDLIGEHEIMPTLSMFVGATADE